MNSCLVRGCSLAFGAIAVVVFALRHDSDPGGYLDRTLESALLIGAIGATVHGVGWTPGNRLIGVIADPRFAWPAMLVGAVHALAG